VTFHDRGTRDIFDGIDTKAARRTLPSQLHAAASELLDFLDSVTSLSDVASLPGTRLEKLSGDRGDQYSIRINRQYRICFAWTDRGPDDVEITDYH
jgi:proteic killer suppression protein